VTYAGAHGRDEVGSIDWVLHREWVLAHETYPLSVRRAEATKIAIDDLVAPSNHLRWALGVVAGALLVTGTFVASSLGGTSESADTAGSAPEHASAALEQRLSVPEPPADAPPPVPAPAPLPAPAPAPAPAPVNEQPRQKTAPTPTEPRTDAPAPVAGGGEDQHTAPSATTPPPAPAQNQQWGHWGSGPQQDYGTGYDHWGHGTQQWSPVAGFGDPTWSSYSAATSTPTGPAMSMLDPFCGMTGR
jgi:hypothetical protein